MLLVVAQTSAAIALSAAPSNDRVAGATGIEQLPFSDAVDTTAATVDEDDQGRSCFSDTAGSVWYRFTPSEDARVDLATTGSNFATTLDVYDEATGELLTCNDDGAWGADSRIRLQAAAGTTYLIRVAGAWGETGALVFGASVFTPPPPPANDTVAGATAIAQLPFSDTVDASSATLDTDDALDGCYYDGAGSVWYRLTGDGSMIDLTTAGSDYNATIEVVQEDSRAVIACAEDYGDGQGAAVRFRADADRSYLIRVASAWGDLGTLVFGARTYTPPPAPVNDTVRGATPITTLPFRDAVNTEGALDNTDDSDTGCFGSAGASVWYRYAPKENMVLDVRTAGSNFDTVLEVFDTATGEIMACDDDSGSWTDSRLSVELTGGKDYLIRAAGFGGDSGDLVLRAKQFIPLAATLKAAETGTLTPGGRAVVAFTMTCNQPAYGDVSMDARQALGPLLAAADSYQSLTCNDTVSLPVRFTPRTGAFTPGLVEVDWAGYACISDSEYEEYAAMGDQAERVGENRALKAASTAGLLLPDHDEWYGSSCVELTGRRTVVLVPGA